MKATVYRKHTNNSKLSQFY